MYIKLKIKPDVLVYLLLDEYLVCFKSLKIDFLQEQREEELKN